MKTMLALLTSLLLLISCSSDDPIVSEDHFIFGTTYGYCIGNCTHLFKYEGGEVFEDEMERFFGEDLVFSETNKPDIVPIAEELLNAFPQELIDSDQETYGCPDCADQGTIFLQREFGDNVRSWYIDTRAQDDWSKELKDFHKLISDRLGQIVN